MNLPAECASESETTFRDWERRKEFCGFTDDDAQLLRQLRPEAERFVDEVVEELYRRFLQFEETRAFLADPATLARAKAAQRTYFLGLTAGDYGEKYFTNRLRIGRVHQQIGLPPRWYMGAYSVYVQLMFPRVMAAVTPADKAQRTFSALLKLVALDTEIAVSTYIHARDEVIGRQGHELVETERALQRAERFAILGEMAGTIAHELSQPLQVINVACSAASEELADANTRGAVPDSAYVQSRLGRVPQQIETVSNILRDLRSFVRGVGNDKPGPFDPAVAVRGAVRLTEYGVRLARGALSTRLNEPLPFLVGNIGRLEQALIVLINDARDSGARSIDITADAPSLDGRDFVRIIANVCGPIGGPADDASELSISSIAADPRSSGSNLGLRICQRIIGEFGGRITIKRQAEGTLRVEILLPVARARANSN